MPGVGGSNVYGRSSGTWEPAEDMQGRYSGAWAQADEVYVRHGGAWVKVWEFNTAPPAVSSLAVAYSPNGTSWDAVATWSLPAEPDLDTVYVRWTIDGATQPWVQLANTATSHTYDVPSGSTAEVTVYLEDTGGLTSPTAQASGGVSPLDAPQTLAITQVDWQTLRADWTHPAGSGRTGYSVTWSGGTTSSTTVSSSTTSSTVTVTPNTSTTVVVYATNSAGNGASRSATGTAVNVAPAAPGTPTIAYSDATGGNSGTRWRATASWTLPSEPDLGAVKVRWNIGGSWGSWYSLAGNATSHTIDPTTSGSAHQVQVYVEDLGGLASTTKSSTTTTSPSDAPTNVNVTQTGLDSITVTWTRPGGAIAEQRRQVVAPSYTNTLNGLSSGSTSHTASATSAGSYTVSVGARSVSGGTWGHYGSDTVTVSQPAPGTPTVSSWTYTSVNLTWSHATYRDGGYEIQRATGTGSFSTVANVSSTTTSYNNTGLSNDTQYRWRVRAKGVNGGYGAWSGELRVAMGHDAYSVTSNYSASNTNCNIYRNTDNFATLTGADGVVVPSNATISTLTTNLSATFSTSLATGWNNRQSYPVVAGTVLTLFGYVPSQSNPWQQTISWSQNTPGLAGYINVNSGWSHSPTGGYRLTGTITVNGTQTTNYPAVANSYW